MLLIFPKDEARNGQMTLSQDRGSLVRSLRRDCTITPPFRISQMTETAVQEELTRIWESSSNQAWYSYVQGSSDDTGRAMWIIRWFLWQAFADEGLD